MCKTLSGYLVLLIAAVSALGCGSPEIGLDENGLRPCPGSPNCVTSMGKDKDHRVDPIRYLSDRAAAVARMKSVVLKMPGSRIVLETPEYLHAEFTSRIMRFVDDVEFWFPEGERVIHLRSASRLGYSDFGANRERVEKIQTLFLSASP